MQKIEESLKAAGATWGNVVFTCRFTVDVKKHWQRCMTIRSRQHWKDRSPPRTLI
jgi:enamine deaminase RidA (YjgF/YER057c/UK114 family)